MDSFFFVLRKKNNQLTSLHVIHHAMMPMVSWIFLKFVGGGHSTFFMFLNMGVHVVMYFYYLMSSMGRRCRSTSGGRSTSPACSCSSLSHSPSTEACHSLQTAATPRLLCSSYSSLEFSSSASSLISTSRPTQRKRNKIH